MCNVFSAIIGASLILTMPAMFSSSLTFSKNRRSTLRILSAAALGFSLSHCGFALRTMPNLAFSSLYLKSSTDNQLNYILSQQLSYIPNLKIIEPPEKWHAGLGEIILEILDVKNERITLAKTASGQIRELELRLSVEYIIKDGKTLEPWTEKRTLAQRREISYNESLVLAKDEEESMQNLDMRRSIAQQIIRQLSMVKKPNLTSP